VSAECISILSEWYLITLPTAATLLSLVCPYTFNFSSPYGISIDYFNLIRISFNIYLLLSLIKPTEFYANTPIP